MKLAAAFRLLVSCVIFHIARGETTVSPHEGKYARKPDGKGRHAIMRYSTTQTATQMCLKSDETEGPMSFSIKGVCATYYCHRSYGRRTVQANIHPEVCPSYGKPCIVSAAKRLLEFPDCCPDDCGVNEGEKNARFWGKALSALGKAAKKAAKIAAMKAKKLAKIAAKKARQIARKAARAARKAAKKAALASKRAAIKAAKIAKKKALQAARKAERLASKAAKKLAKEANELKLKELAKKKLKEAGEKVVDKAINASIDYVFNKLTTTTTTTLTPDVDVDDLENKDDEKDVKDEESTEDKEDE